MSAVDDYVADLERRLAGRVPPAVLEARLREVRSHLAMAAAEGGEARSLRRFGSPAATARALVRQARGYDARSSVSLAWPTGLLLLAALIAERFWSAFVPTRVVLSGGEWSEVGPTEAVFRMGLWIPFLGVMLFATRCLRTRRWLAAPIAAWAAAGLTLSTVVLSGLFRNVAPPDSAKRIVSYRNQLATPSTDEREVGFWRQGQPPAWTIPYTRHRTAFITVPGLPLLFTRDVTTYDVRLFYGSKEAARRAWDANGEGWARTVAARRQGLRDALAALEVGRAYLPPSWTLWVGYLLLRIALMSAVLLAFNALALLLGRLTDALPPRRLLRPR